MFFFTSKLEPSPSPDLTYDSLLCDQWSQDLKTLTKQRPKLINTLNKEFKPFLSFFFKDFSWHFSYLTLETFTFNAQIEQICTWNQNPITYSTNVYHSLIKQLKFCAERRNRSFVACDFYRETLLQSKGCWKLTYDFSLQLLLCLGLLNSTFLTKCLNFKIQMSSKYFA